VKYSNMIVSFVILAASLLLNNLPGTASFAPQSRQQQRITFLPATLENIVEPALAPPTKEPNKKDKPRIVLVAGFESFNRDLYDQAAKDLNVDLKVFADSDIRIGTSINDDNLGVNPEFENAIKNADAFIGSLIFDYDDVLVVKKLLNKVEAPGVRLVFESATELMSFNQVGTFSMATKGDGPAGPPPAVKAILSKFSSGKDEDRINAYLKLLKIGPSLLKYVPGEKAGDLRMWLEAYRFWNQGGKGNFQSMMRLVAHKCRNIHGGGEDLQLPDLEVTPDIGLLHPLTKNTYFGSPESYLKWRLSNAARDAAAQQGFVLAPADAPRVAVLLYRKHVITDQRYVLDLIRDMEAQKILPIPIFINGVEAHTIVRDLLTSEHEIKGVLQGKIVRDKTFQPSKAISVDVIISTIGFPLVGKKEAAPGSRLMLLDIC
jgi:magnesium chelatase subunit H